MTHIVEETQTGWRLQGGCLAIEIDRQSGCLASVVSLRLAVERGLRIGQPWLWISALFGLMGVTSWAIALRIGG